jgi:hypothetical protein
MIAAGKVDLRGRAGSRCAQAELLLVFDSWSGFGCRSISATTELVVLE